MTQEQPPPFPFRRARNLEPDQFDKTGHQGLTSSLPRIRRVTLLEHPIPHYSVPNLFKLLFSRPVKDLDKGPVYLDSRICSVGNETQRCVFECPTLP
jgi:hypothetical protein